MNTLAFTGGWNSTKGRLRQKWAQLTENDLRYVGGQRGELVGRIQKRTGATREAIEKALDDSCAGCE